MTLWPAFMGSLVPMFLLAFVAPGVSLWPNTAFSALLLGLAVGQHIPRRRTW